MRVSLPPLPGSQLYADISRTSSACLHTCGCSVNQTCVLFLCSFRGVAWCWGSHPGLCAGHLLCFATGLHPSPENTCLAYKFRCLLMCKLCFLFQ